MRLGGEYPLACGMPSGASTHEGSFRGVSARVWDAPCPNRWNAKDRHHREAVKGFGSNMRMDMPALRLAASSLTPPSCNGGRLIGGSLNPSNDPEQGGWRWVLHARCPYPHTKSVVRILHKPLMQLSVVVMRPATVRWQDVAPTPWHPHAVQRSLVRAYACWRRYVPFCMPVGG